MILSRRVLFIVLVTMNLPAWAQMDTSLLEPTTIDARDRLIQTSVDSVYHKSGSLVNVLQRNSSLVVMPQSGSSLATLSIRGGTSEQSTIYWHGLRLNSNLNGTMDLNLIPASFISQVEINSGQSTTYGSGAVAGSLNLLSDLFDTSNRIMARVILGSFREQRIGGRLIVKGEKNTIHSISIFEHTTANRYRFETLENERDWLTHAGLKNAGVLYGVKKKFKRANPLTSRLWIQSTEREIPAMVTETHSQKSQIDHALRWQADWSTRSKDWGTVRFTGGVMADYLWYGDSVSQIFSDYTTLNFTGLAHYYKRYGKLTHFIDAEFRRFQGTADTSYSGSRNEIALGSHVVRKAKKSVISIGARVVKFTDAPRLSLPAHVSFQRKFSKFLEGHAKLQSNYRMPTFNSLYWTPGGNPDLLPEQSLNSELGIALKKKFMKVNASAYGNIIYNQIQWLPGSNGYWEANQTSAVTLNRGLEMMASVDKRGWSGNASLTYCMSSDTSNYTLQRIYLPKLQHSLNAQRRIGPWTLRYNHVWIGKRYVDYENTESLKGVLILNSAATYSLKNLDLGIEINNLLNNFYAYFLYRPNPTREFKITLLYHLK